jgi:hypothetical protein
MKTKLFIYLFLVILASSFVSASVNDYLDEFNNGEETCQALDAFYYSEYQDSFINYHKSTAPVIIQCCISEECTAVIFDLHNQQLLYDRSVKEIIDLNYLKFQIQSGNISKTYFVSEGANSCYFHGKDTLNQETANLVAQTTEEIALIVNTKKAKQVADTIKVARAVEIFSPFAIADFGLSYACNFQNKKLNKAVETLGTCNQYITDIGNNYAKSGYINSLSGCFTTARLELKDYYDNSISQVKCGLDKGINAVKGFWDWLTGLSKGNANAKLTVEKTECELAKEIANEIKDKEILLHHPRREGIFQEYANRINQKRADFNTQSIITNNAIIDIKNITPSWLKIIWNDMFYEPNYNLSEEKQIISKLNGQVRSCDKLYKQLKYNSAINCLQNIETNISTMKDKIIDENNTERKIDHNIIGWIIGILIALAVGYYILHKEREKRGY